MNHYHVRGYQRGPYGEFMVCVMIEAADPDDACAIARSDHLIFPIRSVEFTESV